MDSPEHNIWYLAYGSNINHETFTGGRGIQPLDAVVVRVPGWKLTMDIGGTPYSEPAFSSIAPRTEKDGSHVMDVVGVAYLITAEQMLSVVGSEGGGITYSDILVHADVMDEKDSLRVGGQLMVRTLGTAFGRSPEGRPSKRYMVCRRRRLRNLYLTRRLINLYRVSSASELWLQNYHQTTAIF
jgi:gliotoxin/aspirochlorine biosynthesis gamma-glutamylcyclotransferase